MYCSAKPPYASCSCTLKTILASLPLILLQLQRSPPQKNCYVLFTQQERKCSFTATTSMYTSCMFGRSFGASSEHNNPRLSSCRIHFCTSVLLPCSCDSVRLLWSPTISLLRSGSRIIPIWGSASSTYLCRVKPSSNNSSVGRFRWAFPGEQYHSYICHPQLRFYCPCHTLHYCRKHVNYKPNFS